MAKGFVAAAEQVTRYGRQLSHIEWTMRQSAFLNGYPDAELLHRSGYMGVFEAYQAFITQFDSNVREVLTRTFWQAYYS